MKYTFVLLFVVSIFLAACAPQAQTQMQEEDMADDTLVAMDDDLLTIGDDDTADVDEEQDAVDASEESNDQDAEEMMQEDEDVVEGATETSDDAMESDVEETMADAQDAESEDVSSIDNPATTNVAAQASPFDSNEEFYIHKISFGRDYTQGIIRAVDTGREYQFYFDEVDRSFALNDAVYATQWEKQTNPDGSIVRFTRAIMLEKIE